MTEEKLYSWKESFAAYFQPSVLAMMFLGFSAGVPLLLIFSSLSLWLNEAGIQKSSITLFSLAALAYSFKFVWAPIVDRLPLPFLTRKLGIRRSWLLLSQFCIMASIASMAMVDPASGDDALFVMALAAVALGFSSATQDIVIDAYRIEAAEPRMQGIFSSAYVVGYRVGMIVSGAGALFLASWLGTTKANYQYESWQITYLCMSAVMLIGICTTFFIGRPKYGRKETNDFTLEEYIRFFVLFVLMVLSFIAAFRFLSDIFTALQKRDFSILVLDIGFTVLVELLHIILAVGFALFVAVFLMNIGLVRQKMVNETYIAPVKEFFQRYNFRFALLLLLLVGTYRISDIVLGVIANLFYQDVGFTKDQIATVAKLFGLVVTILGSILGGVFVVRYGVMRMLLLGAVMVSVTNLFFMMLANAGPNMPMLYFVMGVDSLAAGFASIAFIAFLSSLTNIQFTAMQYAIFSSMMTLFPKILGSYSGRFVEYMGYSDFFLFVALLGVPVIVLVWVVAKYVEIDESGLKISK